MLRYGIILLIVGFSLPSFGQRMATDSIQPDSQNYSNIFVKKLSEDSLHSSYMIWIKTGVKAHYHANHTEQVYIVDGSATMTLGDSIFEIQKGDLILIPMGTKHSVVTTSKIPLKVISIQAPKFDGDRIWVKQEDHE
ncbi:cupin domain-containing protein [bacterium]|nr:cupin domain-containing protein [bacterium]